MKNIIFNIDGGIGKSIMATAVCEAIKKQYPKENLIVITAYPEVFLCNPHVDKHFNYNQLSYFYKEYIENGNFKAFMHNPYLETNFIQRKEHLLDTWCAMFGIKYNNEQPKLYLTQREETFYARKFASDKPVFVIQTNGGAVNQEMKYSWSRDIPFDVAQQVVNEFANEFNVVHIRRNDQIILENTTPIQADLRALFGLINISKKRLFMDSFAQHCAKALGLDSVVCWIGNTPFQFGYENNINIFSKKETKKAELKNSFLSKYNIVGDLIEFPYNNENEIFNVEEIILALKKQ
jgi:uncharacterized phage-like protein YoqJ